MAIKAFNISVQEQVAQVLRLRRPVITGADAYRETGETLERTWTGPWSELESLMRSLPASATERLDCTLTRQADGDFSELKVTATYYTAKDDPGGGDSPGGEEEPPPGSDAEHPAISCQTTGALEPILSHPKFAAQPPEVLQAFNLVMSGHKLSEKMQVEGEAAPRTIASVLSSSDAECYKLIMSGVTQYYSPHTVLTKRYKSAALPSGACCVPKDPQAGIAAPSGRNWLYIGPGIEMNGEEIWVTETYELSGPGGWNDYIYGQS